MKLKSFKRFLTEEDDKNAINAFIENTFQGNWNKTKADFGNFIEKYSCKDGRPLYRIIFLLKSEVAQLTRLSDLKQKIAGILTTENQGHPRFYTKADYHDIPDQLSFLASIGEKIHGYTDDNSETSFMGVIISKDSNADDNVDFSNYDKSGNKQILDRIERTQPVLSVNSETVKIVAGFEFEQNGGWQLNDLNKDLEDNIGNTPAEEPEAETSNPEDQEQVQK